MSVMLYKYPGKHKIHGDNFDYIIVDESEVDGAIADGWSYTTVEAKTPVEEVDNDGFTREELEERAKLHGIKFNKRTSDDVLAKKIYEAENVVD